MSSSTPPPTADHPDVWDGLTPPARGYPVTRPAMPALARWSRPFRGRVQGALNRSEVTPLRRGVYLRADERQRDPELVAVAAVGERLTTPHAVSHASAARVIGLWTPIWDGVVHVSQEVRPSGQASKDASLRRHHRHLAPEVLRTGHGLVLTSVEQTAVDCALSMAMPQALPIVDSALLIGADREEMVRILDALAGRRGVSGARATVLTGTAQIGSPAESRVRARIVMAGMPEPETLIPVETELGGFELDIGWRERRVAIEVHGRGKYRTGADPVAEAVRRQALFDAGWRVVEIRTGESPAEYLPRIRRALALGGVAR